MGGELSMTRWATSEPPMAKPDHLHFTKRGYVRIGMALVAAALLVVYRANVTSLIQLYIIGVFVSFTLGQTGMVVHWTRLLRHVASTTRLKERYPLIYEDVCELKESRRFEVKGQAV